MRKSAVRLVLAAALFFLFSFLTACGGGSGSGNSVSPVQAGGIGGNIPSAPSRLDVFVVSPSTSMLSWSLCNNTTGYNVYRDGIIIARNIATAPYVDNNLALNSTHTYKVTALNSLGESGFSNEVTVTMSAGTTTNLTFDGNVLETVSDGNYLYAKAVNSDNSNACVLKIDSNNKIVDTFSILPDHTFFANWPDSIKVALGKDLFAPPSSNFLYVFEGSNKEGCAGIMYMVKIDKTTHAISTPVPLCSQGFDAFQCASMSADGKIFLLTYQNHIQTVTQEGNVKTFYMSSLLTPNANIANNGIVFYAIQYHGRITAALINTNLAANDPNFFLVGLQRDENASINSDSVNGAVLIGDSLYISGILVNNQGTGTPEFFKASTTTGDFTDLGSMPSAINITTGPDGNMYGLTEDRNAHDYVIKFTPAGKILWTSDKIIDGEVLSITAVNGMVYVTFSMYDYPLSGQPLGFTIIKDSDGSMIQ